MLCSVPRCSSSAEGTAKVPETGIAALPGFTESLRLLVNFEQYSLTDIGMMFGVSRERVRQLCARFRIPVPPRVPVSGKTAGVRRVWDDEAHRFLPVRSTALMDRELARLMRRDVRAEVRAGYRAHIAEAGRTLAARIGRPITAREWWVEASGREVEAVVAHNAMLAVLRPVKVRAFALSHGIPLVGRGRPAHTFQQALCSMP